MVLTKGGEEVQRWKRLQANVTATVQSPGKRGSISPAIFSSAGIYHDSASAVLEAMRGFGG